MKNPRILIVDSDSTLDVYAAALAMLGTPELEIESQLDRALARLRSESFDLAVIAVSPELDGLSLLKTVRELDRELPVIVVAAAPTVDSATASLRLGAGDYLSKPISAEALAASARRLLSQRR